MKKTTILRVASGLLVGLLTLEPACTEKWGLDEASDDLELQMGLGLPLAKVTARVDSFLPQSDKDWVFDADPDGTVYLKFNTTSLGDYNQTMEQRKTYTDDPVSTTLPAGLGGDVKINVNLGKINDDMTIKVDWGVIDSLQVYVDITGISSDDISNMKLSSKVFSRDGRTTSSKPMHAVGNGRFATDMLRHQDLYMNRQHEIPLTLELTLKAQSESKNVTVTPSAYVGVYDVLYGMISPDATMNKSHKSVELTEFFSKNNLDSLVLPFKNPQIRLTTQSNVGGPMKVAIDNVKCVTIKGKTIDAEFATSKCDNYFHTTGNNSFDYTTKNYPTVPGDTADNELYLDKTNGRTDLLFNYDLGDHPREFSYDYTLALPDTFVQHPESQMFVTGYPFYNMKIDALMPLDFNNNLSVIFNDTAEVDLSDKEVSDVLDSLDWATLYLTGVNGLPVKAEAWLTYLDANKQVIHFNSSLCHVTLTAPAVDEDGKVIQAQLKNFTPIQLNVKAEQGTKEFQLIKNIRYVVFRIKADAPEGPAHFEKTNNLKLNVALKGHGKYIFK